MDDTDIRLLRYIVAHSGAKPASAAKSLGMDEGEVRSTLDRLERQGMVKVEHRRVFSAEIKEEAEGYMKEFPEEALLSELLKGDIKASDVRNGIALGWAVKNGWARISNGIVSATQEGRAASKQPYGMRELLVRLKGASPDELGKLIEGSGKLIELLKGRKLIEINEYGGVAGVTATTKGVEAAEGRGTGSPEALGQLTKELLLTGGWKGRAFKTYDVNAPSDTLYPARLHPMHEFLDKVRKVWISMGFTEVEGPIIEPSFWNFDVLFSPQDHPTRDMQDTFFLSNPKTIDIADVELVPRVKNMHERAWKGSWSIETARQALLRTQTTGVSARHIYKYADYEGDEPLKLFSVGKVFRNESIDYKHLAELHQVDGIIIGKRLSLANLMHAIREFYSHMGIDARVRPSYFPFVEPGMEVFYFDEEKGDSIELCGAGVIRKEITSALGSKNTVLAWGAGLDRLMFNELGIGSLTELYKNDVDWLRKRNNLGVR